MKKDIARVWNISFRIWMIIGVILVSACTRAPSPVTTKGESSPSSSQSPTLTPPSSILTTQRPNSTAEATSDKVTISFAAYLEPFNPDLRATLEKLVRVFEQGNPSIQISLVNLVDSKIQEPGDIAQLADVIAMAGDLAYTPGFINLQPLIDASPYFNLHDFTPGIFSACADQDGNPYGVSLDYSAVGIYYDPKVFDQFHEPYPQPGWTWEQFKQTIVKVSGSAADGNPIYGFVDGLGDSILLPTLFEQLEASGGKVDTSALASSVGWYLQMVRDHELWPVQFSTFDQKTKEIYWEPLQGEGQAAMWINSWDKSSGLPGADIKGGVFVPFPIDQADDHTTPVRVTCGAISAGSKVPQAAWAWLNFLSYHDLTGTAARGYIPARQSLIESSAYWSSLSAEERNSVQYVTDHARNAPYLGYTPYTVLDAIAASAQSGADLSIALQGIAQTPVSTQPTPTLAPFVVNTPIAPTEAGVQTIRFNASYSSGDVDIPAALNPLITAFEKLHPEIKVKFDLGFSIPDDGHSFPTLSKNYDCFEFPSPGDFMETPSDQYLLDLTPLMDADPAFRDDFYPAFLEPFQKDGKLYALPTSTTIEYMAYNADLLTRLGLPFPSTGWSFEDMLSLAQQATNPSSTDPIYGMGISPSVLLAANDVKWFDSTVQPPKALFKTDEAARGLAWLTQLYQQGTLYWTADYMNYNQAILNGQVAIWMTSGNETYDSYGDGKIHVQNLPYKVGYVAVPILSSGDSFGYPPNSFGYYISSQAKYPQACWTWIKYLSDQPSLFGGYSPRKTVLEKEFVGKDPDQYAVVKAAMGQYQAGANPFAEQTNPLLGPYSYEWNSVITEILDGGDITAVLAKAQGNADVYLACISQKDLTGLDPIQVYNQVVKGCYDFKQP